MQIHLSKLTNPCVDDGYDFYIFYETGHLERPIMLLDQYQMENLFHTYQDLKEAKK